MESTKLDDELYELQYYEFSSSDFIEQFRDLVLETTKDVLEDFRKQVVLNLPQDAIPLYDRQSAELYLEYRKILFDILKKDGGRIHVDNLPCSKSDIDRLEGEVKELELQYKRKRAIKHLLEKEIETLDILENLNKQVKTLCTKLKHYQETTKDDSVQNLYNLNDDLFRKLILIDKEHKFVKE
ncbi:hypothetical protein QE152_g22226 [Popillia japonica]|uniref:Protein MIS12 homolog n=1 Tax=Popillia japonica TaxID=7064 RepID=A0AAW1KJA9_POPJA